MTWTGTPGLGAVTMDGNLTFTDALYDIGASGATRPRNLYLSSVTLGSVLFAGTGGLVNQNNAQLFWDNTNLRLGIGVATPQAPLSIGSLVPGTGEATNRGQIQIASGGSLEATSGLEFKGNSTLSGFGYKLASVDFGSLNIPLILALRNNGVAWAEAIRVTLQGLVGINFPSPVAQLNIQSVNATTIGLMIRAFTAQNVDAIQLQTSLGAPSSGFTNLGALYVVGGGPFGGTISASFGTGLAGNTGMVIRGVLSQTGDLQQWQNIAATVMGRFSGGGSLVVGSAALALAATDGFIYSPTMAGTPSGTPTAFAGTVPFVYDTTGGRLDVFTGGVWRGTASFTCFASEFGQFGQTVTTFLMPNGPGDASTESFIQSPVVVPIEVTNMSVTLNIAPGGTASRAFTLRKNGLSTVASITITGLATTGSWSGSVTFAAGDLISIIHVPTGLPALSAGGIATRMREVA